LKIKIDIEGSDKDFVLEVCFFVEFSGLIVIVELNFDESVFGIE